MAIDYDASDFDPNKRGGFETVDTGKCHLVLQQFSEYSSKSGDHEAEFEVVSHEKQSEIGKVHKEFLPSKGKATFRLRELAIALGMVTVEQLVEAKEQGRSVPLDFNASIGRQMFGTITKDDYNGKEYFRLGTNLFAITDDRTKSHPFALGTLKRSGIPLDQIPAYVSKQKPPASQQQPPAKPNDSIDELFT